ncbi:MAG: EAL domain-containing protein [Campylobacterales bacterium]|nr:EAL domain-containing protein [Campylobacterales bacterium]
MLHPIIKQQLQKIESIKNKNNNQTISNTFLQLASENYYEFEKRIAQLQNTIDSYAEEIQKLIEHTNDSLHERMSAILKAIPDLVLLQNEKGEYVDVFDEGKEHLLYVPKEFVIGKTPYDIFSENDADIFYNTLQKAFKTGQMQSLHYTLEIEKNKHYFEARIVPSCIRIQDQNIALVIIRDYTNIYLSEKNTRLLEIVFSEATEGVLIEDENCNAVFVNPAMEKLLGLSHEECLGKNSTFFSKMLDEKTNSQIYASMERGGHWHGETKLHRFDGKSLSVWLSIDIIYDDKKSIQNIVIMVTDISEVVHSRDRFEFIANHDMLTNLPNRSLLFDRLEHTLQSIKRNNTKGALLFIDLDHFKQINDTYGHRAGDKLLQVVAKRLQKTIRKSDTLGRLAGDEFLLIIEEVESIETIISITHKIQKAFELPFHINSDDIHITMSIGIALIPEDGDSAEALINAADIAMYKAKEEGRNGFQFYSKEYTSISHQYFHILQAIRQSLKNNTFYIAYQPQFSLRDGKMTGIEALLRYDEETFDYLPVTKLIQIAEENGTIIEIGAYVLKNVCEQINRWKNLSLPIPSVSINLTKKELENTKLMHNIKENLQDCCIPSLSLQFEITENAIFQENIEAKDNAFALQSLGCTFSINNFGTGYSSMRLLKELNLEKLKIDKSFIHHLATDHNNQVIVSAMVRMAKELGLKILAEGVETEAQIGILKDLGCEEAQGYFFSPPLSAEDITFLLKKH